jgi:4-amino-4-deoxy-L-arabinose transferase-like glycosyltransferase
VPSLFDPPWINDEGTYFAVAQAMAHGYRLYVDVWENKPPALYLVYYAVYHLFGPSLVVLRLIVSAVVVLLTLLVTAVARAFVEPIAALVAGLLAGLLLGVAFLEGTSGNAEIFLALFAALGVYLGVVRRQPVLAALALLVAVLFKAVGAFDAVALGLWYLWHDRELLWRYMGTLACGLAVVAIVAAVAGILGSLLQDAVIYDLGYVGYANGGGIPWLSALKLVILAGLTLTFHRARFPFLWTVYATAGALISGRFFGHYALQMVAPITVSVACLLPGHWQTRRLLTAVPVAFAGCAILSTLSGSRLHLRR